MSHSSSSRQTSSDAQLKKSAARFYEDSFLNSILRNILHPGGLKLTEQLAVSADIDKKSVVLDIESARVKESNCNCNDERSQMHIDVLLNLTSAASTQMFLQTITICACAHCL